MLLRREAMLSRLMELLTNCRQVDVAVAWATECDALSELLAFARRGKRLRAIVGLGGNLTHPNALRELKALGQLRIVTGTNGLFHPKFYLFHKSSSRIGWVGSANLTRNGFQVNEELVFEYQEQDGEASDWFNRLWGSLAADCTQVLHQYEKDWRPPPSPPSPTIVSGSHPDEDIYELSREIRDWPSYVSAISKIDRHWSHALKREHPVIGETNSWLNTIQLGKSVVTRPDWSDLTQDDADLILGRDPYGALGNMTAAGAANNVFKKKTVRNLKIRARIRAALTPVLATHDRNLLPSLCKAGQVKHGEKVRLDRNSLPNQQQSLRRNYDHDPDYFTAVIVVTDGDAKLRWLKGQKNSTLFSPSRLAALIFNKPHGKFDGSDYASGNQAMLKIPGGGFDKWVLVDRSGHSTFEDLRFVEPACAFIKEVSAIPGFSGGFATRLLALARPDQAVSVNNASRDRLAQLARLPANAIGRAPHGRAHSYGDLLRWFHSQKWYSAPDPHGTYEELLMGVRAALFDVFVYGPLK